MTEREKEIEENYLSVKYRIEEARRKRGDGSEVTLLAATKTVPAEEVLFAASLGLGVAGENRAQEFTEKYDAVSGVLDYHFIGTIQKNKLKYIVGKASLIHSVGSTDVAEEISKRAGRLGTVQNILIEVNSAEEENKSGFSPAYVEDAIDKISELPFVNFRGIMTMGPANAEKSDFKKYFQETYAIFIDICKKKSHNIDNMILSMGMSDSFDIAIEEGANLVRVGSAIFGKRKNI